MDGTELQIDSSQTLMLNGWLFTVASVEALRRSSGVNSIVCVCVWICVRVAHYR